jgi:hypothetical protein
MKWTEKVKEKFDDDPVSLIVWAFLSILMFATLAGRFNWWNDNVAALIRHATDMQKGQLSIKPWLPFTLDIFLFGVPILALLLIRSEISRRRAVKARSETSTIAHKTMLGMMVAAEKLRHRSFPDNPNETKSHVSIENTYIIHQDFTTEVTRKYQLRAMADPIHFCEIEIGATSSAERTDYLDSIHFKVHSHDQNDVVYLPIENDGYRKKVVLYFLPRILSQENTPRTFSVTYKWPKMLAELGRIGQEKFAWSFNSGEPIGQIKMSFFLQPGTGKNLSCEFAGPKYPGATIEKASREDWPGYVYEVHNAPAGRTQHAIRLLLREP